MSRVLISFKESRAADLLSAHLVSNGIESKVVFNPLTPNNQDEASSSSAYQVLVKDEHDLSTAITIANDFIRNPNQAKFQDSAWEQGVISSGKSNTSNEASGFAKALYEFKQTPFTFIILALCSFVFAISFLGYFPLMGALLEIRPLGELLQTHQWWRLVGPNFLHFSFMHIAFNLVWWWMLGRQLEISFGTSAIIIFFFIASLFANVSQLIVSGPNFGGLSGIVYALVGFVWWIGLLRPTWLISLPNNVIYFLLAWLVIGYFDILWVNMANEAHTFGLISGCLMALIIHLGSPKSDKAS